MYNNNLKAMAKLSAISYQTKRPKTVKVAGDTLNYNKEKSTGIYAHYENENIVIVSAHGVNSVSLLNLAVGQFFTVNTEQGEVKNFCKKYDELIKEERKVYLIGHSLGTFMILSCSANYKKKINSFLFAPYIPRTTGKVIKEARQPHHKKIMFANDFVGVKLINGKIKPSNTIVFQPTTFLSKWNFHKISVFIQSPKKLNKMIK